MTDFSWSWQWCASTAQLHGLDYLLSFLTTVGAISAVVVTWRSIWRQRQNSRIEKMADTLMECDRRYNTIREVILKQEAETRKEEGASQNHEALNKHYERAYWALQFEQWSYFRLGLVPQNSFKVWVSARCREFADTSDKIFGHSYKSSWNSCKKNFENIPDFIDYMRRLAELFEELPEEQSDNEPENPAIESLTPQETDAKKRQETDANKRQVLVNDFVQDEACKAAAFYKEFRKNLDRFGNNRSINRKHQKESNVR